MYKFPLKTNKKTILLMGSGRSGSTWLAGLLASPFRYRLLFEPFHPGHVPGAELVADHYYPPSVIPKQVVQFVDHAFNDRINSEWVAQSSNRRFNMHRWRFWPKVHIIKCIRGNLLIPAIRRMYGHELPIIVLMRHPGAVVDSFLRVKFPWAFDLSTLLSQTIFSAEYDLPLEHFKTFATDPVGTIMVRWLLENLYLLKNSQTLNLQILFYEDLLQDPIMQISQLCQSLNLAEPPDLAERVKQPSYTTHPRSPIRKMDFNPQIWRENLPEGSVARIDAIHQEVGFSYPWQPGM